MILQFGTGVFIRGFFDLFLQEAMNSGGNVEPVVVVQSTGSDRAHLLNESGGIYHVVVRGLLEDVEVDRMTEVRVIERALQADQDWESILKLAQNGAISAIVSNATESSYAYYLDDHACPTSYPARLASLLEAIAVSGRAVQIFPCELVEKNASALRNLVLQHLEAWGVDEVIRIWIATQCEWVNTLVDRITPGFPANHPAASSDPLLVMTEPYAYWGLETSNLPVRHPSVTSVENVRPFFTRKVRILNGLHTAMVAKALPLGILSVADAMNDPEIAGWLERVAFEEIVPTLEGKVEAPREFAHECFTRFRNPFFEHRLASIATGHGVKVEHRIMPTVRDYRDQFGAEPPLLSSILEVSL